jgi:hypothetical protein
MQKYSMINHDIDENHDVNGMDEIMHQDEDEERLTTHSITFEDTVNNIRNDKSCSSDYIDGDDEILQQAPYGIG